MILPLAGCLLVVDPVLLLDTEDGASCGLDQVWWFEDLEDLGEATGTEVVSRANDGGIYQATGCADLYNGHAFRWAPPTPGHYIFSTQGSTYDTSMYASRADGGCACDDDGGRDYQSVVELSLEDGQQAALFVGGTTDTGGQLVLDVLPCVSWADLADVRLDRGGGDQIFWSHGPASALTATRTDTGAVIWALSCETEQVDDVDGTHPGNCLGSPVVLGEAPDGALVDAPFEDTPVAVPVQIEVRRQCADLFPTEVSATSPAGG